MTCSFTATFVILNIKCHGKYEKSNELTRDFYKNNKIILVNLCVVKRGILFFGVDFRPSLLAIYVLMFVVSYRYRLNRVRPFFIALDNAAKHAINDFRCFPP